jgi:hypothetical protein
MDPAAVRRSMMETQSAVAQAQMMAQQQASAAQQQQRNSSYFAPPMLAAQTSFSAYNPMQAAAMAQMALPPMVAVARLANCNKKKETNSTTVVRNSVPRFNVAGGLYSVAQWARKSVEDNLEWIVKLIRRRCPDEDVVMLAYGDGCQTVVLLDDAINKMPEDMDAIPKIGIGVSSAPKDTKDDESKMARDGVLQPTDSVWDHLRFEHSDTSKDKKEQVLFIHTSVTFYGEAVDGRRRILQVKTKAPEHPLETVKYVPNPMFEQQLLAKWKGVSSGMAPELIQRYSMAMIHGATAGLMFPKPAMGMAAAAAHVAATTADEEEEGILITFNPKELILLERAFDNTLTKRDLKAKGDKWTEDDKKNCQYIIQRANKEFKWVNVKKLKAAAKGPAAKTKEDEKTEDKKATQVKKESVSANDTKKTTPAKKTAGNKSVIKEEASVGGAASDSDDEPISKLKAKKEAEKASLAPGSRRDSKSSTLSKKKGMANSLDKPTRAAVKKEPPKKKEDSPKKRIRGVKKETAAPPPKKTRSSMSKVTRSRK